MIETWPPWNGYITVRSNKELIWLHVIFATPAFLHNITVAKLRQCTHSICPKELQNKSIYSSSIEMLQKLTIAQSSWGWSRGWNATYLHSCHMVGQLLCACWRWTILLERSCWLGDRSGCRARYELLSGGRSEGETRGKNKGSSLLYESLLMIALVQKQKLSFHNWRSLYSTEVNQLKIRHTSFLVSDLGANIFHFLLPV